MTRTSPIRVSSPLMRLCFALGWVGSVAVFLFLFTFAQASWVRAGCLVAAGLSSVLSARSARMGITISPDAVVVRNPLWTHTLDTALVTDVAAVPYGGLLASNSYASLLNPFDDFDCVGFRHRPPDDATDTPPRTLDATCVTGTEEGTRRRVARVVAALAAMGHPIHVSSEQDAALKSAADAADQHTADLVFGPVRTRRRFARARAFIVGLIWPLPFGLIGAVLFGSVTWASIDAQVAARRVAAQGITTTATSCEVRVLRISAAEVVVTLPSVEGPVRLRYPNFGLPGIVLPSSWRACEDTTTSYQAPLPVIYAVEQDGTVTAFAVRDLDGMTGGTVVAIFAAVTAACAAFALTGATIAAGGLGSKSPPRPPD